MASRAQTDPRLPLADLVTELRESGLDALAGDDPTASLPAVLSWSLRGLTTEQRTVFALLATMPGPDIGLPAAASLVGLPLPQTRAVLRTLVEASLLHRGSHGRHAMHDLIRAYATHIAQQNLHDQTREAALRRVCDFYTHTAYTADRLLKPHRPPLKLDPPVPGARPQPLLDDAAALAWFETEHSQLLAAQHTASSHGWYSLVWQLAWSLDTFHYRQGHRHDQLTVWQAAADATAKLPDPTDRILTHRRLGFAYAELERKEEALGHLGQALALSEQHRDPTHQAHTHHVLARAWERWGEYRQARDHATRALSLCRTLDQPVWEADALNVVAWCAVRLGDYDAARTHFHDALSLYQRHGDRDGEATALGNLGYIAHHASQYDHALAYYRQSLALLRETGDSYHQALALDWMGQTHAAVGQLDQARAVWREGLELYRRQGRNTDAAQVQRRLDDLAQRPDQAVRGEPSTASDC
jgi:tetratricopeptide (TPR) repeat protein